MIAKVPPGSGSPSWTAIGIARSSMSSFIAAGSCGYWRQATDLDSAQEAKHDLICRKLAVTRGRQVFDIGCGWGAFMKFAAERYGASFVR